MPADASVISETFLIKHNQALGALGEIEAAAGKVSSLIGSIKAGFLGLLGAAGIEGLATTAKGLLGVNNAMEQTTTVLAGMLQANKFAKTFADGMELSATAMEQIRKEAEKLPGTDVDFLEAFKVTFQAMKDVGMRELPKMITFSDNMVAVAKAYGVDSAQASRDINLMLSGHAGEDVKTFRLLKGQLGVKTTEEFNKLNAAERVKRMSGLLEKNKGMLKAFENTWDAISSTTASIMKNISLAFGGPLFETAKHGLKAVNDLLSQYSQKINLVAGVLGKLAAGGIERIAGAVSSRIPRGSEMGLQGPKGIGFANSLPGAAGSIAALVGGPLGGALIGGFLKAINQGGSEFASQFTRLLAPVREVFTKFTGMFESITDRVRDAFLILAEPMSNLFKTVLDGSANMFDKFKTIFADKEVSLKNSFTNIGIIVDTLLTPAIKWVGEKFTWLADNGLRKLVDKLGDGSTNAATFAKAVATDWKTAYGLRGYSKLEAQWNNARADVLRAQELATRGKLPTGEDTLLGKQTVALNNAVEAARLAAEVKKKGIAATTAKPPPPTININNAKFSIEQQFAPGFDPDRVAVAFKRGVGESVMNRVNSAGLTPLFTPT